MLDLQVHAVNILDGGFRYTAAQGLRVIDASAIPYSPGAHPIASIVMMSRIAVLTTM